MDTSTCTAFFDSFQYLRKPVNANSASSTAINSNTNPLLGSNGSLGTESVLKEKRILLIGEGESIYTLAFDATIE
jgi:hypothetical protein